MNVDRNLIIEFSYPRIIRTDDGLIRRYWVLRTHEPIPGEEALRSLEGDMSNVLKDVLFKTYTEAAPEVLIQSMPHYKLVPLGERNVALRIDFQSVNPLYGDSEMAGQWNALRLLHQTLHLVDVQGLPVVFWFQLK